MRGPCYPFLPVLLAACGGIEGDPSGDEASALRFKQVSIAGGMGHEVPAESPMVAGTVFLLNGASPTINQRCSALSTNDGVAIVTQVATWCSCFGTSSTRKITVTEACAAGETRSCLLAIWGTTKAEGDATIHVTDESGLPLAAIPLASRTVHQITPIVFGAADDSASLRQPGTPGSVTIGAQPDGAHAVERGRLIGILPVFRDREGRELHFASGADAFFNAPADGVLSAREPIANWFQVRSAQVGETVVTVSAPGGPSVGVSIDVIR